MLIELAGLLYVCSPDHASPRKVVCPCGRIFPCGSLCFHIHSHFLEALRMCFPIFCLLLSKSKSALKMDAKNGFSVRGDNSDPIDDGIELRGRRNMGGTIADEQEMETLGRTQQLNVQTSNRFTENTL